jgi:hypothetical protein
MRIAAFIMSGVNVLVSVVHSPMRVRRAAKANLTLYPGSSAACDRRFECGRDWASTIIVRGSMGLTQERRAVQVETSQQAIHPTVEPLEVQVVSLAKRWLRMGRSDKWEMDSVETGDFDNRPDLPCKVNKDPGRAPFPAYETTRESEFTLPPDRECPLSAHLSDLCSPCWV